MAEPTSHCSKRNYRRRRDAVRAAKRLPFPMRPYLCEHCDQYHLTKQPKRDGTGRAF